MATSRYFLIHSYKDGEYVDSIPIYSRRAAAQYLREQGARFSNDDLSYIDDGLTVFGDNNAEYEVEYMDRENVDPMIEYQGITYIPLQRFCHERGISPSKVRNGFYKGTILGFTIGKQKTIYVDQAGEIQT